jgi:transposase
VNEAGKPELVRPSVPRARLHELIAALPPCVIGMEACSGAHHWARLFMAHGHTVRLMAPKFVVPYRLSGKRSCACTVPARRSSRHASPPSTAAGAHHEGR